MSREGEPGAQDEEDEADSRVVEEADSCVVAASSSSPAGFVVLGACAGQHPARAHDSRSPQSHAPPVSLRYMM